MILPEPNFTDPPSEEAGPPGPASAPEAEWTWEDYDRDRLASWRKALTNPLDPLAPRWYAAQFRKLLKNQVLLWGGREFLEVICEWPELGPLMTLGPEEVEALLAMGDRLLSLPYYDDEEVVPALEAPAPPKAKKGEADEWDGYRRLKTAQRDLAASRSIPFRVEGVRRAKITVQRAQREVWQVLADFGRPEPLADRDGIVLHWPWHSHRVISVPVGNRQRDDQMAWVRERAPLEFRLVMYWKELSEDRRLLCFRREG